MRDLHHEFHDALAIIGVHSAKYTTEGKDKHLEMAVRRLKIDHPVVNDSGMRVWQEYGVRAWPSLMFIGPDGKVIGKHEGEFDPGPLREVVAQIINEAAEEGAIGRDPIPALSEPETPAGALAFPTALQTDGERIYIADTIHNRIVVAALDGTILQVIGSGDAGIDDGPPGQATFHAPHGLWLASGTLYVADTENHAIRSVDLESGVVMTIAGTGEIARSYGSGGPALETPLRSPWDVALTGDTLYIAMAGNHQLWMLPVGGDQVRRFAGTGHEGKRDDRVPRAWLAQPSGLDLYDGKLLFADAETSSVRTSDIDPDGLVKTLVGEDLFDWGDIDGDLSQALLQHATGVAWDSGTGLIYVSDTYNNKVKRIDPDTGRIETLAGDGQPGHLDGPGPSARFFEPHGLDVYDDVLFVADTNNHAIRRVELSSGEVSTVEIR